MYRQFDETPHLSEVGRALHEVTTNHQEPPGNAEAETSRAYWYALRTYPRHEKRVCKDLGLRSMDNFLPLYETVHRWKNGCKVRVELPLFPGYVFVKTDLRERYKILNLPGAVSIVGSASGPWPLPEQEIECLRASVQTRKFEPHPYLAVGQKVRIKWGPLASMTGFLVRQSGGLRVVLNVEMIQQAAAVEVDADDVEPIGPAPTGLGA